MRTAEEMVAYALEMDAVLLPFAPELLEDLEELGTDPQLVVDVIKRLDLSPSARVLDLGCGKGAVSLAIARQLDLPVFGIDLLAPFIRHCRSAAAGLGLKHQCSFGEGDILAAAEQYSTQVPADVVVFAALGDVLGPLEQTVGILRRYVTEGGFLLIADDYVKPGSSQHFPRFENYRSRDEMIQALESHGDALVHIVEESGADMAAGYDRDNTKIRNRAVQLGNRHPSLREAFLQFADEQQAETAFLEEHMVSALWVLRRAAPDPDGGKSQSNLGFSAERRDPHAQ